MRRLLPWTLYGLLAFTITAAADLSVKDGGGTTRTIFGFVCQTSKLCNSTVLIDSSGNEVSPATSAQVGGLTETAPASDTASSGLNGRLQRVSQRISSMIALLPTSLGAGGGLKIDGSGTALPVSGTITANAGTGNHAITAASGSVSAGAYAAGALAASSLAAGAGVDGWDLTQGTKADAAWTTGSGSVISLLKAIAAAEIVTNRAINAAQINGVTPLMGNGGTGTGSLRVTLSNDSSAIAGKGEGATGSAVPSGAQLAGVRSGANMVGLIQASASVKIDMSTATTTQLVALSGSTVIYITAWDVLASGTQNFKLVYGTGTNCGTGTTDLTGNYNLTAQAGIAKGSGIGPILFVPAGNALCAVNSAAFQASGSVSYTQF